MSLNEEFNVRLLVVDCDQKRMHLCLDIFSKKQNFLKNIFKKYKCGIMIDNFKDFLNFPTSKTKEYKTFQKYLIKFDKENLSTSENEKIFYQTLIK